MCVCVGVGDCDHWARYVSFKAYHSRSLSCSIGNCAQLLQIISQDLFTMPFLGRIHFMWINTTHIELLLNDYYVLYSVAVVLYVYVVCMLWCAKVLYYIGLNWIEHIGCETITHYILYTLRCVCVIHITKKKNIKEKEIKQFRMPMAECILFAIDDVDDDCHMNRPPHYIIVKHYRTVAS